MKLTPSEDLFLEVLAARHRLGEKIWTFESRHRAVARTLREKDLIRWKDGVVEKTILAWLTDAGKEECLSTTYVPPIAREAEKPRRRAHMDCFTGPYRCLVGNESECPFKQWGGV